MESARNGACQEVSAAFREVSISWRPSLALHSSVLQEAENIWFPHHKYSSKSQRWWVSQVSPHSFGSRTQQHSQRCYLVRFQQVQTTMHIHPDHMCAREKTLKHRGVH